MSVFHEQVESESRDFLRYIFKTLYLNLFQLLSPLESLALSFNGGKDCTALLYLCLDVLAELQINEKLALMYIEPCDEFEEVRAFIDQIALRFAES